MVYDVAVIGAGPAGYVAAIKAAQLGGAVIVFEKSVVGGTCLNRGCIPTKDFIKTAEVIQHIKHAGGRGVINDPTTSVDMKKVVSHKNIVVKQLTGGVAALLRSNGVTVISGSAVMESEKVVVCDNKRYEAKTVLLCGGSTVFVPPIKGAELAHTSDTILDLEVLPKSLCIIGGGVIGCEIAAAFSAFGSKVTIVELADKLVPMMDEELSAEMKKTLSKHGIDLLLGQKVESITKAGAGLAVSVAGKSIECSHVLLSTGRVADLSCLGKLADKIKTEKGKVVVDQFMQTNIVGIYAPGDVNGLSMLAHAAFKMGEVAASNAMGHKESCNLSLVPNCVYTLPEAASVGLTQKQAEDIHGKANLQIGKFAFAANGRAIASDETSGFVKVIAHKKYGEILGVHIFGAIATEMIIEAAVLMAAEVPVGEAAQIIHPHPTYTEAFAEACADALGICIHLPKKK